MVEDVRRRSGGLIAGAQDCAHGGAADPVRRAFVTDGEAPASGPRRVSLAVTTIGDRAGAGDYDDAGAGVKCRFEGDLHVADDFDGGGENLGQGSTDDRSEFGTGGSGTANTSMHDLRGRDAGGGAGLAHRFVERLARLHLADANNVAGTGGRRGQELRFVAYGAGGFGAAAVDSEIVGHEESSNTGADVCSPFPESHSRWMEMSSIIGSPGSVEIERLLTAKVAKKGR